MWLLFHLFIREVGPENKNEKFNLENKIPKKLNNNINLNTKLEIQNNKQNINDNQEILKIELYDLNNVFLDSILNI